MFEFTFPVSGVTTNIFFPPIVSFFLAYFGAMTGVTGAFLLIPFQMSFLGYTSPSVSATNFVYNVVAIPATVMKFWKEGKMNWLLAWTIVVGTIPGLAIGYYLRIKYLSNPQYFKPFVGVFFVYLSVRMLMNIISKKIKSGNFSYDSKIMPLGWNIESMSYKFGDEIYSFDPKKLLIIALLVGIYGGAYGIGGGALLAPICITTFRLPVHTIAGATLFGTFVASILGAVIYNVGAYITHTASQPDYLLGGLFGIGGLLGGYWGAKTQKYFPERTIKIGLLIILIWVAFSYLKDILK